MTKNSKKPPTKAKPFFPEAADLPMFLGGLRETRPAHVPRDAVLLYAGISLPGDNAQRTGSYKKKLGWQADAKHHFSLCMNEQPHPGRLNKPRVHIQMNVAQTGDEGAYFGRAKWLIDRLQVRKDVLVKRPVPKVVDGVLQTHRTRTFGLLDLIEDDKLLSSRNCTFEEQYAKPAERGVAMWVWNEP